jgi:osmotically-inducible protein OsmY
MADYRRHYDDGHRRDDRDRSERASDGRTWFGDDSSRPYWGPDEPGAALGAYRTDDRPYHDRYRTDRYREDALREREQSRSGSMWGRPRYTVGNDAADQYFRAAREQREDFQRYEAETGYYPRSPYAGRGPKDYRRSDERVREEICDCMTDDPMLDASDITVQVSEGVVTLSGSVSSRDQKRRAEDVADRISGVKDVANQLRVSREANGHAHTAARSVAQSETETPSKSSSTTT